MKPKRHLFLAAFAAFATLLSAFAAKADDFAYAVMDGGNFGSLDLNTGAFTLLGTTGLSPAIGLGVAGGQLFTTNYQGGTGTLYSVNPANGSLTTIGTSNVSYDDLGSTTTGLYAVGTNGNLYSLNPVTGGATLIGATGLSLSGDRNLSTNGNTLYAETGSNVYTVNTVTGAATLLGSTGGPEFAGLVVESGILYAGLAQTATINLSTGAATTIAPLTGTGASEIFGLAPDPLIVPEPSTWALLGTGALLLAAVAVRRRVAA